MTPSETKKATEVLAETIQMSGIAYNSIGFRPGIAATMVISEAMLHPNPAVMNDVLLKLIRFSVTLLREMDKSQLADLIDPNLDE